MRFDKLEIITNNPNISALHTEININHQPNVNSVLTTTRNKVHAGSEIISHPLAGSVKPHETPYRSIIIYNQNDTLDMESLNTIEQAIERYQLLCKSNSDILTFSPEDIETKFPARAANDFRLIDKQLILSCLASLGFKYALA
ncbi:GrdX [Photobacterium jeanii]|uniref:GrdX n=1 Tax=Photobacterium jeanii TaxID=858640 RepID=A0A178K7D0_9GAMM|nr:GrdX family protein [Photobacterium jeanii]OAN13201.1 GrdX [Photobacterium jeanii]PST89351.1 GrdX [Photobacterium jeanii]